MRFFNMKFQSGFVRLLGSGAPIPRGLKGIVRLLCSMQPLAGACNQCGLILQLGIAGVHFQGRREFWINSCVSVTFFLFAGVPSL